ncbi:RloB domain-containing protein [Pseudoalteromonas sp. SWXJZ94C]|uniref:RloB family protein n=1 Tax=Pseudoalteromonas sp. SWXJZ94C TaxID=2792065 RepID=UPI0018CFB44A|nr:RloB family protein [Pseudoalteromonas sp. SWXJZ94C]MBH0057563.1 RloB domain-containing protein [Pseudoalteromonas sp. SWXJZ94C]
MGSEDLFHKHKAKRQKDLERKVSSRKPYDRILIVCEGSKTEPIYLEEARIELELDSANIMIDGTCGSSPISVVKHAESIFKKEVFSGGLYNQVFCVFDRDNHTTYLEAIKYVDVLNKNLIQENISNEPIFNAIHSDPSFEFWLLLHFNYSTKPYQPKQGKSVGDQVIDDLKVYMPKYKKTQKGIFKTSLDNGSLNTALNYSQQIYDRVKGSNNMNPSTNMHELITYLQEVKGS